MKRLLLIFLCLLMTGCAYLGATEDILIETPDDISISRLETSISSYSTTSDQSATNNSMTMTDANLTNPPVVTTTPPVIHLILNTSSKKIHYYDNCSYANRIDEKNKKIVDTSAEKSLIAEEYTVCSWCSKKRG